MYTAEESVACASDYAEFKTKKLNISLQIIRKDGIRGVDHQCVWLNRWNVTKHIGPLILWIAIHRIRQSRCRDDLLNWGFNQGRCLAYIGIWHLCINWVVKTNLVWTGHAAIGPVPICLYDCEGIEQILLLNGYILLLIIVFVISTPALTFFFLIKL